MRHRVAGIMTTAALLAACSGGDDEAAPTSTVAATTTTADEVSVPAEPSDVAEVAPATTGPIPTFEPEPITWEPFNDAVDVGTIEVPLDYANPSGERIELFLARYNAIDQSNKIGTLLVNPGGPGFGGTVMALSAAQRFDRPLLERFDIIGWDPRGTGESDPAIDCIDDYDAYFATNDGTPDDDAERRQLIDTAQSFAEACTERTGDLVRFSGTNSSARDIDTIRRALGEERISYFGFSYGSELGATWATMFPTTVRAAVLDGAADPESDPVESTLQQLAGFEASLATFLAQCSQDDSCAFHNDGDAAGAFDELLVELDASPIPADPDRPPVNRDVAIGGVALAMYSDEFWPSLAESLAAAQEGDGSGLLELFDAYYQRLPDGTWGNELEAFQVITCADIAERQTVEQADAEVPRLRQAAPRFVPDGSAGSYQCAFFEPPVDPRITITGAGAGPIVVIGTTGDPATPLDSTRNMADALDDGRLVVVSADQHTGYGVNACVIDLVNAYLIELTPPDDETECE